MHMENTSGLRKGAWTHEEDELLKACIKKYGEGKWHLVSQRAGLNRCQKSSRLRWLNYLKPNINRERFTEDEDDMILRLHKLLGNRWSLIAAKLPGRTGNDVKNYWHSHLSKKLALLNKEENEKPKETMEAHHVEVIRPKPQTLSSHSEWLKGKQNFASGDGSIGEYANTSLVRTSYDDEISVHRECDMLLVGGGDSTTLGDAPLSPMWWESLGNLDDELTTSDCYWDFNFCDVNSNVDF